jgi:HJR/Mrr/RecB family endonuclease
MTHPWDKHREHRRPALARSKPSITGTAHTLPFGKLSPRDFERLCLWLVEREGFDRAEHLGAAGKEQGRDVVAWREDQLWAFQCKRAALWTNEHGSTTD